MKDDAHRARMAARKAARALRTAPPPPWRMAMDTSVAALSAGSLAEKKARIRREIAAQPNPDAMGIAVNQEPEHGQ